METKYIFVTGGVVPSLEKGIISSSLAHLLLSCGYRVTIQKLDTQLNIDSGTLSPYEYGECYVTADGHEVDLKLGHYERFTGIETTRANNITMGRIYQSVMNKERRGDYLGQKIQVIPHITDEIKRVVKLLGSAGKYDFVITEVEGVAGNIESLPIMEAIRQLKWELQQNCVCVHLNDVQYHNEELDKEVVQQLCKELKVVQADMLVLRSEKEIPLEMRKEIAHLCNIEVDSVIQAINVPSIYEFPKILHEQHFEKIVLRKTGHSVAVECDLTAWNRFLEYLHNATEKVKIGLVGVGVEFQDAYRSIRESLLYAAAYHDRHLDLYCISSDKMNDGNVENTLSGLDGVIITPGHGPLGVEGQYTALKWCRENDMPTFGIGLGMQSMVIEFVRNVLGLKAANSTEMDPKTPCNAIDLMEAQKIMSGVGGAMRLGNYRCVLQEGSMVANAYGTLAINGRHRHRYEINNDYRERLEEGGMKCVGVNPETNLVEVVEIPSKTWFVGTQYHPEYNNTVLQPNPLFMDFMRAVLKKREN